MRDHREGEKANTGYAVELATAIGNWWNQCLIHKTLVYKTLESLIKCASELSVWRIKREAVSIRSHLPQLRGGAPQVLSSLSQLMQKCRVGSLGKTLPVLAAVF